MLFWSFNAKYWINTKKLWLLLPLSLLTWYFNIFFCWFVRSCDVPLLIYELEIIFKNKWTIFHKRYSRCFHLIFHSWYNFLYVYGRLLFQDNMNVLVQRGRSGCEPPSFIYNTLLDFIAVFICFATSTTNLLQ